MSQQHSQPQPATAGDKRKHPDRRDNRDRRRTTMVWPGTERRRAGDRRSWVGRRQAAAWRHPQPSR